MSNHTERPTTTTELEETVFGRPNQRESQGNRLPLQIAAVVGGLFLAKLTYDNTIGNTPTCVGEQSVMVQPGDTLTSLAREHISVTSGYVDFRGVEFDVVRPSHSQLELTGQSGAVEVDSGYMLPGDVVTMPEACEQ